MSNKFGESLKKIREENKWTLEEMAEKLGSTKQVLSRYERGERVPKITMAAKFAEILDVPLNVFVEEDGTSEMFFEPKEQAPQSREAKIISEGIDKMSPERREQALKVLQAIFTDIFDGSDDRGT